MHVEIKSHTSPHFFVKIPIQFFQVVYLPLNVGNFTRGVYFSFFLVLFFAVLHAVKGDYTYFMYAGMFWRK